MSHRSDVHVVRVKAEHHREPLGIGTARPRLSWQVETDREGWTQTAYQIAVRLRYRARPHGAQRPDLLTANRRSCAWPLPPLVVARPVHSAGARLGR